jgi:drug/metabolite transporter (DMT)-like permease
VSSVLALASAVFFGFGDFCGGLSSRRLPVWQVAAGSQVLGLPVLAVGLAVVSAPVVSPGDLVNGVIGGVAGLIGLALLYGALADGTMSVVAPITGAVAASVPVLVDVVFGTRLDGRQWAGVVVAIVAIVLLAGPGRVSLTSSLALRAVGAGLGFAAFFVAWSRTSIDSGLWPLLAARGVTIPIALGMALVVVRRPGARSSDSGRRVWGLVALTGVLDMAANVSLALALQRGSLGVVSVLSSLYPAVTAVVAIAILGERPGRFESIGIGGAVVAAILLA